MRKTRIAPGEYYHVYNRGNNKQEIFTDDADRARFLFLILHLQSGLPVFNVSRFTSHYVKHRVFNMNDEVKTNIAASRTVALLSFVLMPNHFHLCLQEVAENGISGYMQRTQNAYTKYFNAKHRRSGHLFQGPYQAKHIGDNEQLLYLSSYIHRNPRELPAWRGKELEYPWSSYQDYTHANRWGDLLAHETIRSQFADSSEYKMFTETSPAKDFEPPPD